MVAIWRNRACLGVLAGIALGEAVRAILDRVVRDALGEDSGFAANDARWVFDDEKSPIVTRKKKDPNLNIYMFIPGIL